MDSEINVSKFITIKKSEKEKFDSYLMGNFSKEVRAIPFKSYNVNTPKEKVVFKITQNPKRWWLGFFTSMRLGYLSLTLSPFLVWWASHWQKILHENFYQALSAVVSIFLLHVFLFMQNDYFDHIRGSDRMSKRGGSQVIQRGYLPAWHYKYLLIVFFVLGLGFGTFALGGNIFKLKVFYSTLPLGGLFYYYFGKKLRSFGLIDLLSLLFLGPAIGFMADWVYNFKSGSNVYFALCVLGLISLITLQLKNLGTVVSDSLSGKKTFMNKLGFDRSKKMIQGELIFLFLISTVSNVFIFLMTSIFSFYQFSSLRKSYSPLSSSLHGAGKRMITFHSLLSVVFLFLIFFEV